MIRPAVTEIQVVLTTDGDVVIRLLTGTGDISDQLVFEPAIAARVAADILRMVELARKKSA